jgi:hypothetical protein
MKQLVKTSPAKSGFFAQGSLGKSGHASVTVAQHCKKLREEEGDDNRMFAKEFATVKGPIRKEEYRDANEAHERGSLYHSGGTTSIGSAWLQSQARRLEVY